MASQEPARHALYAELQNVLGPKHGDTLMTYLPQHPSEEVATKDDIVRLEVGFDRLENILREQQRFYVATVVGSMTALTAIFSLVVSLIR
ncbi:MAG: hypothetical protein V3S26_00575 [Acidimicrobiia bacterium]|jgi:hypothetical protein